MNANQHTFNHKSTILKINRNLYWLDFHKINRNLYALSFQDQWKSLCLKFWLKNHRNLIQKSIDKGSFKNNFYGFSG